MDKFKKKKNVETKINLKTAEKKKPVDWIVINWIKKETQAQTLRLFHGTEKKEIFDKFKTPTGLEELDVTKGWVVYLSSDFKKATKYAGQWGLVYEVDATNAVPYKEQRKKQWLPPKKPKYTKNVYVALPQNIDIKWHHNITKLELSKRKKKKLNKTTWN